MASRQLFYFSILLFVDSMHYIFARLLLPHMEPLASAFWVLAVASVEVVTFAILTRSMRWNAFRPHATFYLVVGFLVAASTALSYASIAYLDAGTASLLGKTTTIFSVILGVLWLRERLRTLQTAGALVAIAGVSLIAFQPGDYLRLGSLLVLLSSFLYALHAAAVKRWGEEIDFLDFFVFRLLSTTGFLLLFASAQQSLAWPTGIAWLFLVLAGTVDVTLSRTLYYLTLRTLPMSVHAIILTLSPVVSIGLALLFFGTLPGTVELLGGALVLAGVLLVTVGRGANPALVSTEAQRELAPAGFESPERVEKSSSEEALGTAAP